MRQLKQLARMADLKNPEHIKNILTQSQTWNKRSQQRYANTYNVFLKYLKIEWTPPHILKEERLPFIPTEKEIDQLIASCGKRIATLLQTLKESAMRISEAVKLKWIDLSTEQKTLNITPAKGSSPRIVRISNELITMLSQLPHTRETIFSPNKSMLRTSFTRQRRRAATKLQNPRIKAISFHTFRHWKATIEYHKTKDIIHVQHFLGHRNIQNTMIYINLEQALFTEQNDQFTAKVAHDENEALQLIEAGFEYITDYDQHKIFRKRK
jgi:type 1 fimbriae regulatory protein FimB/type 1 fimbriae regulatory protein FimE